MGFPESALLHELKSQAPEIDFSNVIPIFSQPDGFRPVPSSISDGAISDLDYALSSLPPGKKLFISGGARVYQRYLPYVKRAHLTVIEANVEGDVILDTQSRTMLGMFGLTGQWNTIKFENTEEFKGLSASYFTLEM